MGVYSFKNIQGTFSGPGVGAFPIGQGGGASPEGISTDMTEDKDSVVTGSGGEIMHSLNASDTGTITVSLLKTSTYNAAFNAAYNFQKTNPGSWGQNIIRFADIVRGDVVTATELAFVKQATPKYSKEGAMMEWHLVGRLFILLGTGQAVAAFGS